MALDSNTNSFVWNSTRSPSLSTIPDHYDRSVIAPITLSQRKHYSQATLSQLPPLKFRSTLTWGSGEEEIFFSQSVTSSNEQELTKIKQKLDRLRATLSQALEHNRHAFDKMHYKKSNAQQTIGERDEIINQLSKKSFHLNEKVKQSKNELINQRHERNNNEMRQAKLRRTLIRLNNDKENVNETLKTNDKAKLIEECQNRLLKLKNDCEQEITDRDQQIDELKDKLSDKFNYQTDEHMKFIKAAEQAFHLENQKCNILQEYVDDYETYVYRARKPCCTSTSLRLNKISTQLRLYLIMELTLHELLYSPCSCGTFQRSCETFLRLHQH